MNLQYKCGQYWHDAEALGMDRTDEFLGLCMEHNQQDRDSLIADLMAGKRRKFGDDWDALIRIKPADKPESDKPAIKRIRCTRCGETGIDGYPPFSTIVGGGVCDDCV